MESKVLTQLSEKLVRTWPTLEKGLDKASRVQETIAESLQREFGELGSDVDFVVFGSLARGEWTSGSDVDWTLLIDGQVQIQHQELAQEVKRILSEIKFEGARLAAPGSTGVFGNLTFSHDLVHLIGGDSDSNQNLTRRILLLLESTPIRLRQSSELRAYERVVSAIIDRYIQNDANVVKSGSSIPRFLLNDIVRYWRTMCVDFAWKEWEQAGRKWSLRNVKLRFSRKLLFAAGLLTIYACQSNQGSDEDPVVFSKLIRNVYRTPLEVIVSVLNETEGVELLGKLLDQYEKFLKCLDDTKLREHLENLEYKDVYTDPKYQQLRDDSHEFQSVLTQIFFDQNSPLGQFTQTYGVF